MLEIRQSLAGDYYLTGTLHGFPYTEGFEDWASAVLSKILLEEGAMMPLNEDDGA